MANIILNTGSALRCVWATPAIVIANHSATSSHKTAKHNKEGFNDTHWHGQHDTYQQNAASVEHTTDITQEWMHNMAQHNII